MIERNLVRAHWQNALPILQSKLNGYRYAWRRIYIGATSDPGRRWDSHISNGWQKMVLLYEAFTPDIARALERGLIEHARSCNFQIDIENIADGGEGLSNETLLTYLYVLVADRRSQVG